MDRGAYSAGKAGEAGGGLAKQWACLLLVDEGRKCHAFWILDFT